MYYLESYIQSVCGVDAWGRIEFCLLVIMPFSHQSLKASQAYIMLKLQQWQKRMLMERKENPPCKRARV